MHIITFDCEKKKIDQYEAIKDEGVMCNMTR